MAQIRDKTQSSTRSDAELQEFVGFLEKRLLDRDMLYVLKAFFSSKNPYFPKILDIAYYITVINVRS